MDVAAPDVDDPFEEQRERAENPMKRLFLEYVAENKRFLAVGLVSSIVARLLDLLPPVLLGLVIDAIFFENKSFSLWVGVTKRYRSAPPYARYFTVDELFIITMQTGFCPTRASRFENFGD